MPDRSAPRLGRHTRQAPWPAALVVAILVLGACGAGPTPTPTAAPSAAPTAAPSVSPSASPSAVASASPAGSPGTSVYRTIEDQVSAERGLRPTTRMDPTVLDEAGLKVHLQVMMDEQYTPEVDRETGVVYRALGLLPAGSSVRDLTLGLLGAQVLGFYDPEANQMFVIARSGAVGPTEKATYAHEFVHALQDQHFPDSGLFDQTSAKGHSDRALAWLAVVEGDAILVQTRWMFQDLTPAELQEVMAASADPAATQALENAPAIMRESLMFPYTTGSVFVSSAYMHGGWAAVNAIYDRLPASTEQVMHQDKYAAGEAPREVTVPAASLATLLGPGWSVADEDTIGEFFLATWLTARAESAAGATPGASPDASPVPDGREAAAGWGGDRSVLLLGPQDSYAIVLATAWDTAGDAVEFAAAARSAIRGLPGATTVKAATADEVTVLLASDQATLDRLAAGLP